MPKSLSERIDDFMLTWGYDDHEFCTLAGFPPSYLIRLRAGEAASGADYERLKAFMQGGLKRHGKEARRKAEYDARSRTLIDIEQLGPERRQRRAIADSATPDEREFIWLIEAFADRWGYMDSEFGREAMGDPNFVQELRNPHGRSPTLRTVSKVKQWMARKEAQLLATAAADAHNASQSGEREIAAA